MRRTMVVFHAHPDDESVLTAGVMARAAAEGHRVVFVLATDGGLGRLDGGDRPSGLLGSRRLAEARASAKVLGVDRFEYLGYADSGIDPTDRIPATDREHFVLVPVVDAARQLAGILSEESADVLVCDDRNGGYGHPDHVRAHQVAARAARIAGTPRVLQATAPRETVRRALRFGYRFLRLLPENDASGLDHAYLARAEITHRVLVGRYITAKRASLRAHASQTNARNGADRMLAGCLRLPRPVYGLVFRWEWFAEVGYRGPTRRVIFAESPGEAPSRIRR